MVKDFHIGGRNDASFYAGILISAFALAESLTGMWWGGLSDRVGRKPVLLLGCAGTMLSLLVVGFSTSFTVALVGRIIGGILNGNIGVIQTMVGELVKKPEHEPKAYSVMPFVWSIGTIIGPAIGGTFANPTKAFPGTFSEDGIFGNFPWLLPNLICAALMLVSIVCGYLWLEETHPDLKVNANPYEYHDIAEQTPMITAAGATADPGVDLRQESYGTFNEVDMHQEKEWHFNADGTSRPPSYCKKPCHKVFTWKVSMLVIALGLFTYHSMCYDHLLPIFLQDDRIDDISILATEGPLHVPGGLGLSGNDPSKLVILIIINTRHSQNRRINHVCEWCYCSFHPGCGVSLARRSTRRLEALRPRYDPSSHRVLHRTLSRFPSREPPLFRNLCLSHDSECLVDPGVPRHPHPSQASKSFGVMFGKDEWSRCIGWCSLSYNCPTSGRRSVWHWN